MVSENLLKVDMKNAHLYVNTKKYLQQAQACHRGTTVPERLTGAPAEARPEPASPEEMSACVPTWMDK